MKISEKYVIDARQLALTLLTLTGSGVITSLVPPHERCYALAAAASAIVIQNGPIQKTPLGYVEEAVTILEKWLPLLPADYRSAIQQRFARLSGGD